MFLEVWLNIITHQTKSPMQFTSILKKLRALSLIALTIAALPATSMAQSFSLGADFASRYVWRGVDFGESFSIQPTLEFSTGSFAVGSWASYSIANDGALANEHDLYFSFSFDGFSVGMTDYYFPGPGALPFSNFDGDGEGAHWLEINASVGGTESFPLTVSGNIFVHNDVDNSIYFEIGYPFSVDDVDLRVGVGIVPQESAFYGTNSFGITVLGLSAGSALKITEDFSLPVSVMYAVNPTPGAARSFLVFGFSL